MTLNLIKLSVGIESIEHLAEVQQNRIAGRIRQGQLPDLMHITRMWPKRKDELLDGGSIYWVIKRAIRCRQRLIDLVETVNGQGLPACGLVLDPEIVPVKPRAFRPFQGWRYFQVADAPADLSGQDRHLGELPPDMADELRGLGLI
ncbi:MAG: DUF1489 domain-containing protein [Rhodospirillaceae bacterium]